MAISPLSKSSVPSPSLTRTQAPELASPVQRSSTGAADSLKGGAGLGGALQGLLQQDGFDSVGGAAKGGMEKLGQMLALQVLGELSKILGGEGIGGQQSGLPGPQGASGNTGVVGPNGGQMGLGADSFDGGGVPDLGGEGASFDGGVPDLGGEGASFGGEQPSVDAEQPQLQQKAAANASAPAPVQTAAPAAQKEPAVAGPQGASQSQGASKGKNTMTLVNDGTTPMKVNFTPNAGDKAVDSVTLKPGETKTVQFPDGWSGNFRSDAGDGKNATLGEVKFDGGHGNTYYDVSYIEGHNASMTMQPESGGRLSGTMKNLLDSAPDSVKAKGTDGQAYGIKKSTTSNVQDSEVVDFFRKHVGADQGYVIPTDDASTLGSNDSNLVVHMKNLA
ncbi:hypothetical protein OV208_26350 [Corallococcus sp. bb12-1]|uniref:hypothetical protein n=1 Tax=Corallococcus sp. bb12-1 TaxID=2996784 RepID=UPI002271A39E|nr:hypothetical protein [Corallococcus sp. bb12-1]MCY1044865.1 hypothetical protein [Corallococcus sp. bb12-1]